MGNLDAVSTPGIRPPAAFDRLRGELHTAAGADGVAANRTYQTLAELRERADWFRATMEVYLAQPLGHWYATLAARYDAMANEIEAEAKRCGIIGGEA